VLSFEIVHEVFNGRFHYLPLGFGDGSSRPKEFGRGFVGWTISTDLTLDFNGFLGFTKSEIRRNKAEMGVAIAGGVSVYQTHAGEVDPPDHFWGGAGGTLRAEGRAIAHERSSVATMKN
jgi:hypothetical protein